MATEGAIQAAFEAGAKDIADNASVGLLRAAIERGDYSGALSAVNVEDAAFDGLRGLLVQTYADGGISEITGMPTRLRTRWNSASSQAETYARNVVGGNIQNITADMRTAIQNTIGDGLAYGRSSNRIVRDILGRMGSDGGRTGYSVGLNTLQAEWVDNMRKKLLSGDYEAVKDYGKRDRRFDKMLDGRALTLDQIDRITMAYSSRLLTLRAAAIARTERMAALNNGRYEAWRQSAERYGYSLDRVKKTWKHGASGDPRPAHIALNNDSVMGLNTPFTVNGYSCLYPHDPSLPASEVVNCSCQVRYSIGS